MPFLLTKHHRVCSIFFPQKKARQLTHFRYYRLNNLGKCTKQSVGLYFRVSFRKSYSQWFGKSYEYWWALSLNTFRRFNFLCSRFYSSLANGTRLIVYRVYILEYPMSWQFSIVKIKFSTTRSIVVMKSENSVLWIPHDNPDNGFYNEIYSPVTIIIY